MDYSINKENPFDKVNPIKKDISNNDISNNDIYHRFKILIETIQDKDTLIEIQKIIDLKIKSM